MLGPTILARTMSVATLRGSSGRSWQYHSRSDHHSKVACWCVLLDLLRACDVFRAAVANGKLAFGINHVMVGPINKTLDLVVTRLAPSAAASAGTCLADWADRWSIVLTESERELLRAMPAFPEDRAEHMSEVAIALEAKACMTEHVKSLPRLHAEILATGFLAKQAAPHCIGVAYVLVNAASSFVTPSGQGKTNQHHQPDDARKVVDMIDRAIPLAQGPRDFGYDVLGVTVVDCGNDGSPVRVVELPTIGPTAQHQLHYTRMINNLCAQYRARFGA